MKRLKLPPEPKGALTKAKALDLLRRTEKAWDAFYFGILDHYKMWHTDAENYTPEQLQGERHIQEGQRAYESFKQKVKQSTRRDAQGRAINPSTLRWQKMLHGGWLAHTPVGTAAISKTQDGYHVAFNAPGGFTHLVAVNLASLPAAKAWVGKNATKREPPRLRNPEGHRSFSVEVAKDVAKMQRRLDLDGHPSSRYLLQEGAKLSDTVARERWLTVARDYLAHPLRSSKAALKAQLAPAFAIQRKHDNRNG